MGNNQSMQVGAEAVTGVAGGVLAAVLAKLPLLVFAGAALIGAAMLAHLRHRAPSAVVVPAPGDQRS